MSLPNHHIFILLGQPQYFRDGSGVDLLVSEGVCVLVLDPGLAGVGVIDF